MRNVRSSPMNSHERIGSRCPLWPNRGLRARDRRLAGCRCHTGRSRLTDGDTTPTSWRVKPTERLPSLKTQCSIDSPCAGWSSVTGIGFFGWCPSPLPVRSVVQVPRGPRCAQLMSSALQGASNVDRDKSAFRALPAPPSGPGPLCYASRGDAADHPDIGRFQNCRVRAFACNREHGLTDVRRRQDVIRQEAAHDR